MTHRDTEIVSALRRALAQRVGNDAYELWFAGGAALDWDGSSLLLKASSQFKLDRIRSHFRSQLAEACSEVLKHETQFIFRIDLDAVAKRKATSTVVVNAKPQVDEASSDASARGVARPTGQRRFASLRTFVTGEGNRLAFTSCEMIVDRPGEISPLYLYGPAGTGKTHLLEGIWSAVRRRNAKNVVFLSAEQFTNYFVEALKGKGLPSFRRKYRGTDVLIIDDVHFLAGKKATIGELQHTLDDMQRRGGQVVLSGDRPAGMLKELGQATMTRLASGMSCALQPADRATRLAIARQMATARRMEVATSVLEFIADKLSGDARHLSGALNRLQAAAAAWGRPVDVQLAREALADMIRAGQRPVQLGDIERAVCNVMGLDHDKLQSPQKSKSVAHPRMLAMFLARKHTRAGLAEIGDHFGRRSHTTVVSADKRVRGWLDEHASLSVDGSTWCVDDAIRRIEGELRVG